MFRVPHRIVQDRTGLEQLLGVCCQPAWVLIPSFTPEGSYILRQFNLFPLSFLFSKMELITVSIVVRVKRTVLGTYTPLMAVKMISLQTQHPLSSFLLSAFAYPRPVN